MRTNIKADDIEVTQLMRERLEWICSKLEKMADARNPGALYCDFAISKVERNGNENEFQAEIIFSDGSGHTHRAVATAGNPIVALDTAHDEIERKFFQAMRIQQEKQRVKDFHHHRVDLIKKSKHELAKKYEEEPPQRKRGTRTEDN